jgi:hypothetical protein
MGPYSSVLQHVIDDALSSFLIHPLFPSKVKSDRGADWAPKQLGTAGCDYAWAA